MFSLNIFCIKAYFTFAVKSIKIINKKQVAEQQDFCK